VSPVGRALFQRSCSCCCCVRRAVTNLAGGWLAASFGPKRVLSRGVVVWSLFTMLTPLAAASRQLALLLAVRVLMGVGEGVAFPCMQ
jgi:ACS family sodium-dependent inorganic phosphate cotransporter